MKKIRKVLMLTLCSFVLWGATACSSADTAEKNNTMNDATGGENTDGQQEDRNENAVGDEHNGKADDVVDDVTDGMDDITDEMTEDR